LEHLIEKHIEVPGLEVVKALTSGKTRLSWPERDALSLLISAQRFRVPHTRKMMDQGHKKMIESLLQNYDDKKAEIGEDPGPLRLRPLGPGESLPSEETGTFVTKEELDKVFADLENDPDKFSRETFLDLAFTMAKFVQRMKWTVHYATGQARFITSDCPAVLLFQNSEFDHAGLARPDCEIQFPLSGTAIISITHDLTFIEQITKLDPSAKAARQMYARLPEIRIAQATDEQVELFNVNQADYASHWVFAGNESPTLIPRLKQRSKNVRQEVTMKGQLMSLGTIRGDMGDKPK
jgi:hypothetical protein